MLAINHKNIYNILDYFNNFTQNELKSNFPPLDVYQEGDDGDVTIQIALAGYSKDDIITSQIGNKLVVRTKEDYVNDVQNRAYYKRGISRKKFSVVYSLQPKTFISSAKMQDGILEIKLSIDKNYVEKVIDIT